MAVKEDIIKEILESDRTCRYERTDRCTWVCSNCGVETDVFYQYWICCPVCGCRLENYDEQSMFGTAEEMLNKAVNDNPYQGRAGE